MDIILGILFLTLRNINILFIERELTWWSYSSAKALSIIKWVQIIDHKKFATAALDLVEKVFMVHIAYLEANIDLPSLKSLDNFVGCQKSPYSG